MGGYYARAEGLPDAVADAIRDHYKPVGQGDGVPTAPSTVAVSLADKLDTLGGFFAVNEAPTGSKDPFALRRAAIGILSLIQQNKLRLSLAQAATEATRLLLWQAADQNRVFTYDGGEVSEQLITSHPERYEEEWRETDWFVMFGRPRDPYSPMGSDDEMAFLGYDGEPYTWRQYGALNRQFSNFFADRLKVQQREAGVRHDLIDAVFALGNEDDLMRLLARVKALQNFVETEDGANLLAAYKRASNILKKEDWQGYESEISRTGEEDPLSMVDDPDMKAVIDAKMAERKAPGLSYEPEPAEQALIEALDTAEPEAVRRRRARGFRGGHDGTRQIARAHRPVLRRGHGQRRRPGQARRTARIAGKVPCCSPQRGGLLADRGLSSGLFRSETFARLVPCAA